MASKKLTVPSQGREPPSLEDAELAQIERIGVRDSYAAMLKREALVMDPKKAQAMIQKLAFDAGEVLPNPNFGAAKTKKEREAADAEHTRLVNVKLQREDTIATLFRLGAHDLAFQSRTFARLGELPKEFRSPVLAAISAAPELVPELYAALRKYLREKSPNAVIGARAIFRTDSALEEIGGAIASVDRKKELSLRHAKMLVELGTQMKAWSKAPDAWRKILEPLVPLMAKWDPATGDLGRSRWQLGFAAQAALESLAPKKEPAKQTRKKKKTLVVTKAPIDKKLLRSEKGRERALDELGTWIVSKLDKAGDDAARAVMAGAIRAFYDIREAGDQERGEYAGHFFMVDAVGLGDTDRPVPWDALREKVGEERLERLSALFDEVLADVE